MAEVVENVFAVDEGDDIQVAAERYEWSTPMSVEDVDDVEWPGLDGIAFRTREVILAGGYGSEFRVTAVDEEISFEPLGSTSTYGALEAFTPAESETYSCEDCGRDFDSERGLQSHRGHRSTDCGGDIEPLPDHISEEDVRKAVEESETVLQVGKKLRILDRMRVKAIVNSRGLTDELITGRTGSPKQILEATDIEIEESESEGDDSWQRYYNRGESA